MDAHKRKTYLDIIRIVAVFLVLYTHISADGLRLYKYYDEFWLRFPNVCLECFRTINTPLLFMISGVLLLGKDEPVSVIWKKRILRFSVVLIVFSYIHVLDSCIQSSSLSTFDATAVFVEILNGPVRVSYWYLYSYLSFLITLPFLRKVAQNLSLKDTQYLLFVGFLAMNVFKLVGEAVGIYGINIPVYICETSIFFPLLGYTVDKYSSDFFCRKKVIGVTGICAIVGLSIAALMTMREFTITQAWSEKWIGLFKIFTTLFVFQIIKIFGDWIKRRNFSKLIWVLEFCSGTMFGIYLLENIFRRWTKPLYLYFSSIMPAIPAVFLWIVSIMIVGNVVIGLIKCIPGVKKFL